MYLQSDLSNLNANHYSAALYDFQKVKDVSHRKEVKEAMSFKDSIIKSFDNAVEKQKEIFRSNIDFTSISTELLSQSNSTFQWEKYLISREDVLEAGMLSIVGGYVRNELFQSNAITDIDIVYGHRNLPNFLNTMYKRELDEYTHIPIYMIEDNTMHLIPYPVVVYKNLNKKLNSEYKISIGNITSNDAQKPIHVFINPSDFDFTINCGNISNTDGWLYAPPITLYDIEHKILRPTLQLLNNEYELKNLRQSTIIRAIRFTLKYDMKMHNSMYATVKSFLELQRDRKSVDDMQMYIALRHLYNDPVSLRDEIYATLKNLNMYETENYVTFDNYFNYIENNLSNKDLEGRTNKIITSDSRSY